MQRLERDPTQRLFAVYYAGTVGFAALDFLFDFNVRLSFLDPWPVWRVLYYVFCAACFALIWRHPAWSNVIAAGESLVNLSALIISTALSVMIVSDEMIDEGRGAITVRQLLNFLLSGAAAYIALLLRGRAAHRDLSGISDN